MEPESDHLPPFLDVLSASFLERGIQYFFPSIRLDGIGQSVSLGHRIRYENADDGRTAFDWLGTRYALANSGLPLTDNGHKLLESVGLVISARYRFFSDPEIAKRVPEIFRGVPEDRYVSAFLDPQPYLGADTQPAAQDRVADAIEVLRISALTTYENKRIVTGALIFGSHRDPCHTPPSTPPGALPYAAPLTSIRSFHRLCDGLQTLALVNHAGLLVELVDVAQWTEPYAGIMLPVPSAAQYEAHCRATLCGGHVCLVLTPNGEIKAFSDGAQLFNFIDGRWRLTDAVEKFGIWETAIGNAEIAARLYCVALNLAEKRRGGLFVLLDDPASAARLVAPGDLLSNNESADLPMVRGSKSALHYLLKNKMMTELPATVIESIASIDGGIVVDRDFKLLAFGAILRFQHPAETLEGLAEGGRTTAAISASRYGKVLKVSEDGLISFYQHGVRVWEM